MKKSVKKVLSIVMTVVMLVVLAMPFQVFAATEGVTIYFKNTGDWKEVYGYTWYGAGSTGKAWPGAQMTDAGDGWFKMVYNGTKPLNVIVNNNGTAQTANHTPADLAIDKSTYWFVPSSDKADSGDGMSSGSVVTVYDSAQAGFPGAAATTTSTEAQTTESPSTGNKTNAGTIALCAVITIIATSVMKKKSLTK